MNPTIDILMAHKSIRKFRNDPVNADLLNLLVSAGQSAASSSFFQAVTIIRITDHEIRRQLASIAGNQEQVKFAAEFLIFCADFNRSKKCCEGNGQTATEGFTEQFIVSTVDAALYAQNVVVAAESVGLGICYIGAIRNNPKAASNLLHLPQNVYPVFGLCIGYPAEDPAVKPRLPISVVLKENNYNSQGDASEIAAYDRVLKKYYENRSDNQKSQTWSGQMTELLQKEARPHMRGFLTAQGFKMK